MSWQACIFLNPFEFRAFHYRTALDLYLDGYKKFKAELAPVVLENETQQYHPVHLYAGSSGATYHYRWLAARHDPTGCVVINAQDGGGLPMPLGDAIDAAIAQQKEKS